MKKSTTLFAFLLVSIYSFSQLAWLQMPDFPGSGKNALVAFSINGKGYMGLGENQQAVKSTDWYMYDPGTNTWTQKASFPGQGRSNCATFVIGNKGYVATGQGIGWAQGKELWEYDAGTNIWTQKSDFPGSSRMNATGFSLNGKGYVGTGFIGGQVSSDFYEYDPGNNTWTQKADVPGATRNGAMGFSIGTKGYIGMGCAWNATDYYNDFYEYDPGNNTWTAKADFPLAAINNAVTYSDVSSAYVLAGYFYQYSGISHNPMNMFYRYDQGTDEWTLSGTFPGYPRGYAAGFPLANDIYIGGGGRTNIPGNGPVYTDFWKLSDGMTALVEPGGDNTEFKMYPNPSSDIIYFTQSNNGENIASIRLYDIGGQLLSTKAITNAATSLDLSALPAGMYFVEAITSTGKVLDGKVVKQ